MVHSARNDAGRSERFREFTVSHFSSRTYALRLPFSLSRFLILLCIIFLTKINFSYYYSRVTKKKINIVRYCARVTPHPSVKKNH